MIGMSSVQPSMCQSKVPRQVLRRRVLRRVEGDAEDLGVLALAEDLDLAELAAEHDLGLVVEVEVAEHERPVVLERLERPGREVVVVEQLLAVDAVDLGADRGAELLGGDHGHGSLPVRCNRHSSQSRTSFPGLAVPQALAQPVLLHLAGRRAREVALDRVERLGPLRLGQARRGQVGPHVLEGRGRRALAQAQEGGGVLAEALVGRRRPPRPRRCRPCARSSSSTSWALMFSPPRMMMSDTRSVMVR